MPAECVPSVGGISSRVKLGLVANRPSPRLELWFPHSETIRTGCETVYLTPYCQRTYATRRESTGVIFRKSLEHKNLRISAGLRLRARRPADRQGLLVIVATNGNL